MEKLKNYKDDVIQTAINDGFDRQVAKYMDDVINNKNVTDFLKIVVTDWARAIYSDGWNNCKAILVKPKGKVEVALIKEIISKMPEPSHEREADDNYESGMDLDDAGRAYDDGHDVCLLEVIETLNNFIKKYD